jgi:hypothetical protein
VLWRLEMIDSRRSGDREQFWRMVLDEHRQSGLSARAFCLQQGVSVPSFYSWRRKIQQRDQIGQSNNGPLVPVRIVESGGPSAGVSTADLAHAVEVTTPGGFVLRVDPSMPTDRITALLRAIVSCGTGNASC